MVEEYPDAKPTLLFVGDGPERPRLEALARGLPVRFLGFRDDLERIYGACDVLVLSSYVEGLPNVLLEGMSCGLATVSTALGGACDVIEDGVSGSLVSPGDPESMGAALAELILDPARRDALGAAAADRIAQGFALDVVLPRYVTLYRHLLG